MSSVKKFLKIFFKGILEKFKAIGSTLGTDRKGWTPTAKTAVKWVFNYAEEISHRYADQS